MEINLDNLVPFENLLTESEAVFKKVDDGGKVILVKNNRPAYVIVKYSAEQETYIEEATRKRRTHTLQDAMRIVLLESENHRMHAADLADEIYQRRLYTKKDGGKARYNQIRARSGHYKDLFEALPGNIIKLREDQIDE